MRYEPQRKDQQHKKALFFYLLTILKIVLLKKYAIYLTSNPKGKTTEKFRNARLDSIIKTMGVRMSMRFFILWLVLRGISYEQLKEARSEALAKIDKIFSVLKVSGALERFEQMLTETWEHYMLPVTGEA